MKNLHHYILALIISSTIISTTKSQEFAPIGATWHYRVASQTLVGINTDFIRLESVDSTFFNGKYYRRLESNASNGSLTPPVQRVREENGKVYILIGYEPQEYLYFDKNPNIGDIWYYPVNTQIGDMDDPHGFYNFLFDTFSNANDSFAVKVMGVVDTIFNNRAAKIINVSSRLTMHPENPEDTLFYGIRKIFSPFGLIPSFFYTHLSEGFSEFNIPISINCYQDNYWGLINWNSPFPCNYINGVGFEEVAEKEIQISPNPFNGNFNININQQGNYHLKVYNSVGQLITQSALGVGNTTINLQSKNVSAGLYFVEISNEQQQRLKMEKMLVAAE
jgi:hypothetical protein